MFTLSIRRLRRESRASLQPKKQRSFRPHHHSTVQHSNQQPDLRNSTTPVLRRRFLFKFWRQGFDYRYFRERRARGGKLIFKGLFGVLEEHFRSILRLKGCLLNSLKKYQQCSKEQVSFLKQIQINNSRCRQKSGCINGIKELPKAK